jgi:putative membrane protein
MNAWGAWSASPPIAAILVGSAALYARGLSALWAGGRWGRGVSPLRAGCFGAGLIAVAVALISPMDHAAGLLLSAHMGQHLVLILVAAPLLVVGRPGLVALAATPSSWRSRFHRLIDSRAARATMAVAGTPVMAWFLHVSVVWAWHVPGAYQAGLEHPPVHWLQHASFLGTALLFWWVALEPGVRRRLARGADALFLVGAWVQSGALGALFTFAAVPIYPAYAMQAALLGVDPMKDQQVAGLIMWIPAGFVYLGGACVLFVSWLRGLEDRSPGPVESPEVVAT